MPNYRAQSTVLLLLTFMCLSLPLAQAQQDHDEDYQEVRNGVDSQRDQIVSQLPADCGLWALNKPKRLGSRLRSDVPRLSGGKPAELGQFPSFVKVHFYNKTQGRQKEWWCGGVIVSEWHILTSGHCIKGPIYALANSYVFDPAHNSLRYRSERFCVLPGFEEKANASRVTPFVKYDIAIVRVDRPIQFNQLVQPVCLPEVPLDGTASKEVEVVGLGYLENTDMPNAQVQGKRFRPPRSWIAARRDEPFPFSSSSCEPFRHPHRIMRPRAKILPDVPHVARMRAGQCRPEDEHESTICFESTTGFGSTCKGDSGGPAYGLDARGRQVLYGVPSYVDLPCHSSSPHKSTMANVWNLREPIKTLIEQCSS